MKRNKRLYNIWACMKQRCNNPNNPAAPWYHDKGIRVCEQWDKDFEDFQMWAMENGYFEGGSIDRIDPEKGYSPENCRWITLDENRKRAHPKGAKKGERRTAKNHRKNGHEKASVAARYGSSAGFRSLRRDIWFVRAITASYLAGKEAGKREAQADSQPG